MFKSFQCCTRGNRGKPAKGSSAMEAKQQPHHSSTPSTTLSQAPQATSLSVGGGQDEEANKEKVLVEFYDLFFGSTLEQRTQLWRQYRDTVNVPFPVRAEINIVEAASAYSADANYCMAYFYQYGIGFEKDLAFAFEFYKAASSDGHVAAMVKEADFHRKGWGLDISYERAIELYEQAAEKNSAAAQVKLGSMYRHGKGVESDLQIACALYKEAAKQGYEKGVKLLADCENSIAQQAARDRRRAQEEQSLLEREAHHRALELQNQQLRQQQQQQQQALSEHERDQQSANAGDLEAQLRCGHRFKNGKGVPVDMKMSVYYYQMAADRGSARGQMQLGIASYLGQGCPKDLSQAAHWFQLAADQGQARATFSLSELYRNGQGVKKDGKKAFTLAKIAAKKGIADAEYSLGKFYMDGKVVRRDLDKAEKYFNAALSHGYKLASKKLSALDKLKEKRAKKEQFKLKLLEEAPDTAVNYFKQIIADSSTEDTKHNPSEETVDAYLTLAEFYKKESNFTEAEHYLSALLEIGKGGPDKE
mmetsp:Transcript_18121/g.35431  ORF Transcript_18121/g.35431 Transcript_18121/m.35431 type:complete len:533 (-) Transcript_18121:41-1639(-)